ncbi:5'-nucleotidase C-terminal domain-containing protein [Ureibacillus sp. MALMAid1270]|uniref:5'-nucleotidase C-terminal domain-containing protein n=1 Tax=Ureibacillus sp. MALMAid1270 TaxID=3411629 RepID=UPI003BA4EA1F
MKKKTMSKVFNATLATTAVVGSAFLVTPAHAESKSFNDVNENAYYFNPITELAKLGAINGYPDGTFKPNAMITRGQAATIVAKALKLDIKNVVNPGFTDVPETHAHYAAIATLKAEGILFTPDEDTFKPNEFITRAEMATLIARAFDLNRENNEAIPFEDVTADVIHADNIKRLYDNKVTAGTSKTTFSPDQYVTRGQAATFIYKALNVESTSFELTLMHSNDTHSWVENAPKRAQAVKDVRALRPDALLVDAGDANTGTLYYNVFKGQADLAFLNYMGYDAMTFGNHEFDQGATDEGHQALVDFIKGAEFPFVSSNIDFSQDAKFTGLFTDLISSEPENGKIYNGIIKEVNGEKVGIFGLTTQETEGISSPEAIKFENYKEEAEKAVKAFENMGVDKIILLSHLGYDDNPGGEDDLSLAVAVDGIDIIVGGHSHTKLDQAVVVTKDENGNEKDTTLIVQTGNNSDYLGTLDVTFNDKGVIIAYDGELITLAKYAEDPKALELLTQYKEKVDLVSKQEIGKSSKVALTNPRVTDPGNSDELSVRKNETILGNLITDGMLAIAKQYSKTPVIMALQNGGGIRAGIDAGPITVGEVITVLPFGNTLALMDITGAELKEAFELSVSKYPAENGGFLHVSGAKIEYDSSKPAGERIVSISYKDENGNYVEIKADETYTVATNAFTAKGGDSYDVFEKIYAAGRVLDLGLSDWENFREHLQSLKEIPTEIEGRIVDISSK